MAQYYLTNMAVNIPKILNPALDSIKALIISANQVCQNLLKEPAIEHESKLKQMFEHSSTMINKVIKETILTEEKKKDPEVHVEYKELPIQEALMMTLTSNKKVMVSMFEEIIRGRLLVYYLKQFPIKLTYNNKRIPWNTRLMLGIPNPMPTTYHYKTKDVDIQAQQDMLMRNTMPCIAKSMEASRTTVLTIQHLRLIETYNEYIHAMNMNLNEHLKLLPFEIYNPIHHAPLEGRHQTLLKLYCFMSFYFMTHASIHQAMSNLSDEIQTFLLDIGQEEYTLPLMNGLKWNLKMNQSSLWILKEHKRIVARRIYKKRQNKNKPPEDEQTANMNDMTKEEREYYELRQLMGNTEDRINKPSEIDREHFRGYEYKKQTRKLNISDKLIMYG
jgi:hypothetical protein